MGSIGLARPAGSSGQRGHTAWRGPNECLVWDGACSWRGVSCLFPVRLDGRALRRWGAPGLCEARVLGSFLEHPDVTLVGKEEQDPQPQQGSRTRAPTTPDRSPTSRGGAGGWEECSTSTASPSSPLLDWPTAQLLAWETGRYVPHKAPSLPGQTGRVLPWPLDNGRHTRR